MKINFFLFDPNEQDKDESVKPCKLTWHYDFRPQKGDLIKDPRDEKSWFIVRQISFDHGRNISVIVQDQGSLSTTMEEHNDSN